MQLGVLNYVEKGLNLNTPQKHEVEHREEASSIVNSIKQESKLILP